MSMKTQAVARIEGVRAAVTDLRNSLVDAVAIVDTPADEPIKDDEITDVMQRVGAVFGRYKAAVKEAEEIQRRIEQQAQEQREAENDRRRKQRTIEKAHQVGTRVRIGHAGIPKEKWELGTVNELKLVSSYGVIGDPEPFNSRREVHPEMGNRYKVRYRVLVDKRDAADNDHRIADVTGAWTIEPIHELEPAK